MAEQLTLDLQPAYRTIPLTQGQVALVDESDYEELSKFKWFAHWAPGTKSFYAKRAVRQSNGKQKTVQMAREIMQPPEGFEVDHRSNDTLDNRRHNLRVCTPSQNCCNRRLRSDNASGHKGVTWERAAGKWVATIYFNKKNKRLGSFETIEEAVKAYRRAAAKVHGEFAKW